ncbi:unnamed protein product, partial [Allacma fusca]
MRYIPLFFATSLFSISLEQFQIHLLPLVENCNDCILRFDQIMQQPDYSQVTSPFILKTFQKEPVTNRDISEFSFKGRSLRCAAYFISMPLAASPATMRDKTIKIDNAAQIAIKHWKSYGFLNQTHETSLAFIFYQSKEDFRTYSAEVELELRVPKIFAILLYPQSNPNNGYLSGQYINCYNKYCKYEFICRAQDCFSTVQKTINDATNFGKNVVWALGRMESSGGQFRPGITQGHPLRQNKPWRLRETVFSFLTRDLTANNSLKLLLQRCSPGSYKPRIYIRSIGEYGTRTFHQETRISYI